MLTKLAVCFFLFNLSIVYGFGQDIIGFPAEHDLNRYNGFLSYWQWLYENDDSENVAADETVENILEKYHSVRKRSADADDVTANEGTNSTAPVSNVTAIQTSVAANNESLTNSTANKSEPKKAIEVTPPLNLNATEAPDENITSTVVSTESTPTATELTKDNGTNAATNTTASPTAAEAETSTPKVSIEAINTTTTVNTTETTEAVKEVETEIKHSDKNVTEENVLLGKSPDQANSTIPPVSSTTNHPETHLKTFVDGKKGRKAIEKEDMDHKQSGNAVLTNGDKTMSETDMALAKSAAHESTKTGSEAISPKEGASSTTASSTGNDTKIIIFLGVAVAIVGVAAVGYNYTRKRRRANRGPPRVGQNGDVETGKEMKPLMRRDPEAEIKKEVEESK